MPLHLGGVGFGVPDGGRVASYPRDDDLSLSKADVVSGSDVGTSERGD